MFLRTLLNWSGFGGLAGGALHAQGELLLAQLQQLVRQLGGRLRCAALWRSISAPAVFTNEVDTESFEPARRNASRAVDLVHAFHLEQHLAGLHLATQYSTLPLPLPMRTSSGFLLIGTSGNTRIQIWPPRFT